MLSAKSVCATVFVALLSIAALPVWQAVQEDSVHWQHSLQLSSGQAQLSRTADGVFNISAPDGHGFAAALGYAHAKDRMVQMQLMRVIAQGRLSELIQASKKSLHIDTMMRRLDFAGHARVVLDALDEGAVSMLRAYADGVNEYVDTHWRPLEFMLVGYTPAPWTPLDSLLTVELIAYVGLASTQLDMERFIIHALSDRSIDVAILSDMFHPQLDGLDDELLAAIREVKMTPLAGDVELPTGMAGRGSGSNNWVVSANASGTGSALAAYDPHLEVTRLPAAWAEVVAHVEGRQLTGVTVPGFPTIMMGRNDDVSWGLTYGYMDMIDNFLMRVKDGRYLRDGQWHDFQQRVEVVKRKGEDHVVLTFYETAEGGTLDYDPTAAYLADGTYLMTMYSITRSDLNEGLVGLMSCWRARNVREAQAAWLHVPLSGNLLFADSDGNIGYQQTGLLPRRPQRGLLPLRGWDSSQLWDGFHNPAEALLSEYNPARGYIITANNLLQRADGPQALTLHMGSNRVDRVETLLTGDAPRTLQLMKEAQCDVHSITATRLLQMWRPHLPDSAAARQLAAWDGSYTANSRGAYLAQRLLLAQLRDVYGKKALGEELFDWMLAHTNVVFQYRPVFFDMLFDASSRLYATESQADVVRRLAAVVLADEESEGSAGEGEWSSLATLVMRNMFFDGMLPPFLGFDSQPLHLGGTSDTPCAAHYFFDPSGNKVVFMASWRMVTDLGNWQTETALAGGPSGNRFSQWYKTDLLRWANCDYKRLF